jgi:hypothetical protein
MLSTRLLVFLLKCVWGGVGYEWCVGILGTMGVGKDPMMDDIVLMRVKDGAGMN